MQIKLQTAPPSSSASSLCYQRAAPSCCYRILDHFWRKFCEFARRNKEEINSDSLDSEQGKGEDKDGYSGTNFKISDSSSSTSPPHEVVYGSFYVRVGAVGRLQIICIYIYKYINLKIHGPCLLPFSFRHRQHDLLRARGRHRRRALDRHRRAQR
jgi:hypothetical protein